ncbi:MAG TPA: AbfB domain-containing protein [Clostridia bacterium]
MKHHGIVINMTKNKAIVTTSNFQCYYIKRKPTVYVGKQIEFTDEEIKRSSSPVKFILAAACILFIFTLSLLNAVNIKDTFFGPKTFAYVDVDINPSLEMEIDDTGNVLKLIPLNEDAKVLINKIKLDRISVSKAVNNIIHEVKKNKTVSENDYVLVSSTLNNKDKEYKGEEEKLNTIMNSLKKDIQESDRVNICLLQANINERKDAQSKGISTGRYLLYNKYKSLKNNFSIEEAKKTSINELLKGILDNKEGGNILQSTANPTSSPVKSKDTTQNASPVPSGNSAQVKEKEISSDSTNNTKLNTQPVPPLPPPSVKTINSPFMRFESFNFHGKFIRHQSYIGHISDNVTPFDDSVFKMVPGLANPDCISFESKNFPGYYLRHKNFKIILEKCNNSADFKDCATFKKVSGFADKNLVSFQSFNYPKRYIRHKDFFLQIDEISSDLDKKDATFAEIRFK